MLACLKNKQKKTLGEEEGRALKARVLGTFSQGEQEDLSSCPFHCHEAVQHAQEGTGLCFTNKTSKATQAAAGGLSTALKAGLPS